jgi:hypothetical protein
MYCHVVGTWEAIVICVVEFKYVRHEIFLKL